MTENLIINYKNINLKPFLIKSKLTKQFLLVQHTYKYLI